MMLAHQNSGGEEVREPEMFTISSSAGKVAESCSRYFTCIESLNHKQHYEVGTMVILILWMIN